MTGGGQTLGDNFGLVMLLFAVGVFAGMRLQKFIWQIKRSDRRQWKGRRGKSSTFLPRNDQLPAKAPDATDQLRTVMNAQFEPQPLLNKKEAQLFSALDKIVLEEKPGWQVMAQVSLGEVLKCEDRKAYWCINAKRVDFLIVDAECRPVGAIEYQGGGHFKGAHATAARDAVKKEALRRAGIGYEEIVAGHHTLSDLRRVVGKLIQRAN